MHEGQSSDGRFEISRTRMAAIGGLFGVFAAVLLGVCNPDNIPLAIGVAAVGAIAIWELARWPEVGLLTLAVITVASPLLLNCPYVLSYLFVVGLAIYASAPRVPVWSLAVLGIGVFATNEVLSELAPAGDDGETIGASLLLAAAIEAVMLTGLVVGLGTAVAITRQQGREMVRLQGEHHQVAMEAERHRIARDLHDTAAHQLSAIVVRSETAAQVGDATILREANDFAGDSSKKALQAMRQMVSVLRSDDSDVVQPRIGDLDQVADMARNAGVDVTVTIDDDIADTIDRSTELAIARIVQEALSNVLRHSSASSATVDVVQRAGSLEATIEDPGPAKTGESGSGYGLIGMSERAQSVDGSIECGPTNSGGWRVRAVLPAANDE